MPCRQKQRWKGSGGPHPALVRRHSPTEQLREGWGWRQAAGFDVHRGSEGQVQGIGETQPSQQTCWEVWLCLRKKKTCHGAKGKGGFAGGIHAAAAPSAEHGRRCLSTSSCPAKHLQRRRKAGSFGSFILRSATEDGERRRRDGVLASPSSGARCTRKASPLSGRPPTGEGVFLAGPHNLQAAPGGAPVMLRGKHIKEISKKKSPLFLKERGKRQLNEIPGC